MPNWLGLLSLALAFVSTGIAIYELAVILESSKRKRELQFLLAGINSAAVQKHIAWQTQINFLLEPTNKLEADVLRAYIKARDEFAEIASITVALEGTIDSENSAITAMNEKGLEMIRQANEMQKESQKGVSPDQGAPKDQVD